MRSILTPSQMAAADRTAIHTFRIPSLTLMEQAGTAVAAEIVRRLPAEDLPGLPVLVLCGKGNNGGDGLVIARLLAGQGMPVTVVRFFPADAFSDDAAAMAQRLTAAGVRIIPYSAFRSKRHPQCAVIVDAMLGTSFRGKLSGAMLQAVQWCNRQRAMRIAVDIPTGLDGLTGEAAPTAFRADVTVTLSQPKLGFFRSRAAESVGELVTAGIGIPKRALPAASVFLMERTDAVAGIPPRPVNSHKHSVGKVFILAGSRSMMGAAWLCSQAAMRSGAGQVILGVPETEFGSIAKRTVEVMPLGLPATSEGSLSMEALGEIEQRLAWADVLLIGCGLSRHPETQELVGTILRKCRMPVVLDADGLTAAEVDPSLLKKKGKGMIITPHHGEFSRLTGIPATMIASDPFRYASEFARKHRCTVVLKGAPTVTAGPDGRCYVNSTGNPGMSTAGSGDVLAGITASFLAQGSRPLPAARTSVYVHGAAGDRAARTIGQYGMTAGDILESIPATLQEFSGR
ncbi:MAG: NAD(P)H-hydrate dehydratase [Bacteroidetes bacterium]|nr:NAD(P)H-hydrate dehydratase [Bacteroidota bacterium]